MFSKFFTFSLSVLIALIFMGTASICLAQGNTWTTKADMQIPRMQHGTCVVNGKIYSIGGYTSVDSCGIPATQKVEEYDPSTDTWDTTKTPMPTARHGLSISAVDGKIYAIGGHPVLCEGELSTVEVYDPLTDTWDTTKTPMPTPRGGLSTSVVNGKIYAIGGYNYSSNIALAVVEEYNPLTDTWIARAPMPTVRTWLSTSVVDGKIYAFGGHGTYPPWVLLNTVEAYDPVTNIWTQLNDMPIKLQSSSASTVAGLIYLFGGLSSGGTLDIVWQYNPILDTMIIITQMPLPRAGAHSSELNGEIYVTGGSPTPTIQPTKTVQVYTPHFSLPSIPELVYPGGSIDTTAVEFVWTMSNPFVTRYWFEIATDNQFTNSFIDSTLTDTTYLYSNLNNSESYWWRVKAYNAMGWGEFSEDTMFTVNITSVEEDNQLPTVFSLQQNYPNPFNPTTKIKYSVPQSSNVVIKVFDVLGNEIETLVNEEKPVGNYEVKFDATALPSGIYFYQLKAGDFTQVKKMLLLK